MRNFLDGLLNFEPLEYYRLFLIDWAFVLAFFQILVWGTVFYYYFKSSTAYWDYNRLTRHEHGHPRLRNFACEVWLFLKWVVNKDPQSHVRVDRITVLQGGIAVEAFSPILFALFFLVFYRFGSSAVVLLVINITLLFSLSAGLILLYSPMINQLRTWKKIWITMIPGSFFIALAIHLSTGGIMPESTYIPYKTLYDSDSPYASPNPNPTAPSSYSQK